MEHGILTNFIPLLDHSDSSNFVSILFHRIEEYVEHRNELSVGQIRTSLGKKFEHR